MITPLLFLLLASSAFCTDPDPEAQEIEKRCSRDENCALLNKEIISQVSKLVDPCLDIHSYICKKNEQLSKEAILESGLSEMKTYLYDLLGSPANEDDSELLAVEKKLYQSCSQLDYPRSQNRADTEQLKSELENLEAKGSWQEIENKLFTLGFGYSFFNIKVIPHPERESTNTILLEPPSMDTLNSTYHKVKKIVEFKKQYRGRHYSNDVKTIHNLYSFINVNDEEKIKQFFEALTQAKIGLLAQSTEIPEHYTTVKQLKSMKIHTYFEDISIKTHWVKVMQRLLETNNIKFDVDNIVLKNPRYFLLLTKLLHETPDNIIVLAIQTRAITEHLPYIDWERANLLEEINKRQFCLKETKLYGASRKMVQEFMTLVNDDDRRHSCFRKSEHIFSSIMSVILDEILAYKNSTNPAQAAYYKRKLYHVVENLNKYVYDSPYNIYYGLDISSQSYWKNILEYRKLVASNELNNLRNSFETSRPFSFIDQEEPQNRYVISTVINIIQMHTPNLPKEVYYGKFGVKTAALIHSLLHEDSYNEDDIARSITNKFVHPKYSESIEFCVREKVEMNHPADQVDDLITQVLALNTAYRALVHDHHTPFHSISNTFLSHYNITSNKLFFLSYAKDNCDEDPQLINGILSHNHLFDRAFTCQNNVRKDEKTCILGKLNY